MDVLREVEMNNAQIQAMGRMEVGATARDRQSPGEQYQPYRRRVMPTDNLSITFFPAETPRPAAQQRQPNHLSGDTFFALAGAVCLMAALLLLSSGIPAPLALSFFIPAAPCFYYGRKTIIQVIRRALHRLLD